MTPDLLAARRRGDLVAGGQGRDGAHLVERDVLPWLDLAIAAGEVLVGVAYVVVVLLAGVGAVHVAHTLCGVAR